jgi:hypothetical protein
VNPAALSSGRRYVGVDLSQVQLSIARKCVPDATFERIFAWLRPGGWLMLSLSTIAAGDRRGEWLDVPMYFARFTPGLSERLLKRPGFDIEMSVIH